MRRLLARREREGLTLAELSLRTGVPTGTLGWWASRLRRDRPAGFVELVERPAPAEAKAPAGRIELVLRDGLRVLVPGGVDAAEVQRLVRALESRC